MIKFGLFTTVEGHEDAERELDEIFETLMSYANESPSTDEAPAIGVRNLMRSVMSAERFRKYGATDTVCDEALVVAINERLNTNIGRWTL